MPKRKRGPGGKRAGAGRKPRDAKGPAISYSVTLSPTEADHCKEIAGGRGDTARDTSATVQDGIRLLVRRSMELTEEETPL